MMATRSTTTMEIPLVRPNDGAASLSKTDFDAIRAMVGDLTGIVIKEHKREMIHSRLARRLRALGLPDYASYVALLRSDAGKAEIGEMINAVTTNLTSFYRESHHFEHLRQEILDPMAAQGAQRLRIWSSACSTGEEPYSIIVTLLESAASRIKDARVLATDLDTNVLRRASAGRYPLERLGPMASKMAPDRLVKVDPTTAEFTPAARNHIAFKQLNLLKDWPMRGPFDAIFCRNVLIYFEPDVKKTIVDRMAELLRPNGALYLGHSESLLGEHPLLASEGRTVYRRRS